MAGKTTITAGSTVQIPIAAGTILWLSGIGTAQFVPGISPRPLHQILNSRPAQIGPATIATAVVMAADPAGPGLTYWLTGAADFCVVASDGSKAVFAKVPTGYTDPVPAVAPLVVRGSASVAGDSLAAFGDVAGALTQTASGILAATGGKTACSVPGWTDAHLRSGRIDLISNRGVGSTLIDGTATKSVIGTNIPQFGDGATAGSITDATHLQWIHSGVNHLSTTNDPSAPTASVIIQKFRRMIGIAAPRKAAVFVEGIYPIGLGSAATHYPRRFDIPIINAALATICAQYPNMVYLDPSILSIDGGATGDPKYYLASDLLHLNGFGAFTLGREYARQIEGRVWIFPAFRSTKTVLMPEMAGTTGNAVPNSGTITGTVPGNIRVTIGGGTTTPWPKVTLTTQNNRLYLNVDNSGGAIACSVTVGLNSGTQYLGTLANGDIVVATATLGVTNPVGLRSHDLIMTQNSAGAGTLMAISAMAQSNQELINGNVAVLPPHSYGPITLRTQPVTLNDTLASINVQLSTLWAIGGTGTIDVGDMTLDALVAP